MNTPENAIPIRVREPAGSLEPRKGPLKYRIRKFRNSTAFVLATTVFVNFAGNNEELV